MILLVKIKNGDDACYEVCFEFVHFVKRHEKILELGVPSRIYTELKKGLRSNMLEEKGTDDEIIII